MRAGGKTEQRRVRKSARRGLLLCCNQRTIRNIHVDRNEGIGVRVVAANVNVALHVGASKMSGADARGSNI